jgi:phage-related protein
MAGNRANLDVAVRAVNEASAALKAARDDIDGLGKAADDSDGKTRKLGGALGDVAKIAAGFIVAQGIQKLGGFLTDAVKAAAEEEAAMARLGQTLKSLGGDFDSHMGKVNEAIAAGQKLAFSDDEVRNSFQTLAQATGSVEEGLRRQKLAMDLARGAGIPLEAATRMLSKVNEENVDVLKRLGIEMDANATETEALAAVQAKFGGQAAEFAGTAAGKWAQFQLRMSEVKETIGLALLPIITKLGDVMLTQVVPAVEQFANVLGPGFSAAGEGVKAVFGFLVDNKEAVLAALAGIGTAILVQLIPGLIASVPGFLASAAAALTAAAAWVAANAPMILITVAIAAVVAGIILLIRHWDEIVDKFPLLGRAAEGVQAGFQAFVGWITGSFVPAVEGIYTAVSGVVTRAIGFVRDNWGTITAIFGPPIEAIVTIVTTQFELVKVAFETAFGVIRGVFDVFAGLFTGDWGRMKDGLMTIVNSLKDGIIGAMQAAIDGVSGLAGTAWTAFKNVGEQALDGLKAAMGALLGIVEAIGKALANKIIEFLNSAIRMINNAIPDKISLPGLPDIDPPDNPFPEIPLLARGARNYRGGLAIVGEEGPELVRLPRGADVFTNRESRALAGGNLTFIVQALDAQSVDSWLSRSGARQIADALRREGALGFA